MPKGPVSVIKDEDSICGLLMKNSIMVEGFQENFWPLVRFFVILRRKL